MDSSTRAIAALAWSRLLGLGDDGFRSESPARRYRVDPVATTVTFVRLFDRGVFSGPQWALDRAGDYSDDELATERTLLELTADHLGRALGAAVLSFTGDYVDHSERDDPALAHSDDAVVHLERACPPDDVREVGLGRMPTRLVLLDPERRLPVSGAGYEVWQGLLAHVGVLTVPGARRQGYGASAAGLITNQALDDGLVPQWRAAVDNVASRRLAAALGYREAGTQTTVLLPQTAGS